MSLYKLFRWHPLIRFWSKVKVGQGGCWLWQAAILGRTGYGSYQFGRKRKERAHRIAWQLENGPIPAGISVLHRCDVPACVNPDHLFLGTHADNMRDKTLKGRLRNGTEGQTHCKNGHPLSGHNLYWRRQKGKNPGRQCITCKQEKEKMAKRRKRTAAKLKIQAVAATIHPQSQA